MARTVDPQSGVAGDEPAVPLRVLLPETPSNLPISLTSFVGRRKELAFVRGLIARGRLVTLTGPGGIGKSRLALEVAQRSLAAFPGGVWRIDLSEVFPSEAVDRAVTEALGVWERPGLSPTDALVQTLGHRRVLLVLDECEWVVGPIARLIGHLLQSCPAVNVLATSRLPLGLRGETLYAMPTLAMSPRPTSLDELGRQDAIALCVDRIRDQRPDFRLTDASAVRIHELCRQLDGLPLAIELAAARTRHYELDDLIDRLADQPALLRGGPRDSPERQRSLEATVDWSLGLLSANARSTFSTLAVFRGGFDQAAADAVGDLTGQSATADMLSELVDQSLLSAEEGVRGRTRFRLLEPIRQHALGILRAGGREEVVRQRHAKHFAGLARALDEAFDSVDQPVWLDVLQSEQDNMRQALEWALASDPAMALQMTADLSLFWCRRGHAPEGREWLERAVALAPGRNEARRAIAGLAMMLEVQGEEEAALGFAREAADLSIAAGDRMTEALAWMVVGRLTAPDGDQARAAFRAATEAARVTGVATLRWAVLGEFASLEWGLGQRDAAVAMAQEAVAAGRAIGNPDLIVIPASVLARDAMFAGRADADTLWLECLQASRELGDPILVNVCLTFLALRASWRGDLASAAESLAEAARLLRHVGSPWPRIYLAEMVGLVLLRAGRPLEGLRLIAWKELAMGPDWFDSPPWMDYVRTEVDRVVAEVGDRATEARVAAQSLSFEEAMGRAEEEIDLLLAAAKTTPARNRNRLSQREAEIARLTSAGLTNREIGRRLSISERTAEAHVQHILNKLGLANRAQIAVWVVANGPAPEVVT